jgi:hypothetical protein
MRNALNNNPRVQIAVLAVLVVLVGLMFAPSLMHKKAASTSPATTTSSAGLTTPSGSVNVTAEVTPSAGAAAPTVPPTASATPGATSVAPGSFTAGPGLPAPVVKAWKDGDAIVLLVVRPGGTDDRLVRGSVEGLSGDSGVAVFVTRADRIARYSRITQGVGVSQVPALVVIRPRRLSGSVPQAQVTYGFRNAQSVVQQVHDALYSGKDNLPYSPR